MAKQVLWIQTDLAYATAKEKILKDRHLLIGDANDFEGKFSFTFKDLKDVTFQITTRGKVGIFYPEGFNPKIALERLKPYLVKADGSPASIQHLIKEKMELEKPKPQVSHMDVSEEKIEAYADAEWLTKQWKAFEPLDELFKIERRIRKELGVSE